MNRMCEAGHAPDPVKIYTENHIQSILPPSVRKRTALQDSTCDAVVAPYAFNLKPAYREHIRQARGHIENMHIHYIYGGIQPLLQKIQIGALQLLG